MKEREAVRQLRSPRVTEKQDTRFERQADVLAQVLEVLVQPADQTRILAGDLGRIGPIAIEDRRGDEEPGWRCEAWPS